MLQREHILINQAKKGDVDCFEQLIKEYQQFAYNIALKMLNNAEDAKDATQESLVKVYKNISSYKEQSKFSTWLYRIVVNTCKDYIRKKKDVLLSEDNDWILDIPQTDLDADPVSSYERSEIKKHISQALNEVPEPFKSTFILCDVRGLSYNEIADIQQVALGTVRSRVHRARAYMREILCHKLSV